LNKLIETLQKHPLIIFGMFILTLLSALVTIVLGWEQFYNSFLSKELNIPIWLFLLIGLIVAVLFIFKKSGPVKTNELETVEGKEFGVQQVEMDGKKFVNCTFDGSELIFRGVDGFGLEKNNFKTPPRITFQDYAGNTLAVISALYQEDNFRPYIEGTLNPARNK
jgi:hypothetical protein